MVLVHRPVSSNDVYAQVPVNSQAKACCGWGGYATPNPGYHKALHARSDDLQMPHDSFIAC